MNRRGFLGSILALGAAPAIVRADSLMRIIPRDTLLEGFAEVEWTIDYIAPAGGIITPATFSQIVQEVILDNQQKIRENIACHNALYKALVKRGVANGRDRG